MPSAISQPANLGTGSASRTDATSSRCQSSNDEIPARAVPVLHREEALTELREPLRLRPMWTPRQRLLAYPGLRATRYRQQKLTFAGTVGEPQPWPYTPAMTEIDELNAELEPYGYELRTFALHDSNFQVVRLDGYGGHAATMKDVEEVRAFVRRLADSDDCWCIHLDLGNVDVDRYTGEVTPRDGGPLFNIHDLHPDEWSGASDEAPRELGKATLATAYQICIKSRSRPPYGGLWFKRA